jgi:hypothetical protein
MKFAGKKAVFRAMALQAEVKTVFSSVFHLFWLIFRPFVPLFLDVENSKRKNNLSAERLF